MRGSVIDAIASSLSTGFLGAITFMVHRTYRTIARWRREHEALVALHPAPPDGRPVPYHAPTFGHSPAHAKNSRRPG